MKQTQLTLWQLKISNVRPTPMPRWDLLNLVAFRPVTDRTFVDDLGGERLDDNNLEVPSK